MSLCISSCGRPAFGFDSFNQKKSSLCCSTCKNQFGQHTSLCNLRNSSGKINSFMPSGTTNIYSHSKSNISKTEKNEKIEELYVTLDNKEINLIVNNNPSIKITICTLNDKLTKATYDQLKNFLMLVKNVVLFINTQQNAEKQFVVNEQLDNHVKTIKYIIEKIIGNGFLLYPKKLQIIGSTESLNETMCTFSLSFNL